MTEIKLPPLPDFASEDSTLWQLLLDWRTEDGGPRSPLIESAIDAEINSTLQAYARSAIALNATTTGMEAPAAEPVAYVPMHPRLGPLWADTYDAKRDATQARSSSYPPMALYTAPPTGEVKPEAVRGKFESAQHYANRLKMAVTSQWLAGWDACIEYLATQPPEVKPAPALSDEQIIAIAESLPETIGSDPKGFASWGQGYRQDADGRFTIPNAVRLCVPFARAIQAALAAQEKPNAPALSAQPAEPTDEQIIERCKAAGIAWIPPGNDEWGDGFPGVFDLTRMSEMRALLTTQSHEVKS